MQSNTYKVRCRSPLGNKYVITEGPDQPASLAMIRPLETVHYDYCASFSQRMESMKLHFDSEDSFTSGSRKGCSIYLFRGAWPQHGHSGDQDFGICG